MSSSDKVAVVLGAGRSMTSGVAKGLHEVGFPMAARPGEMIPAGPGNPDGHYECRRLVALNDEILRAHGATWDKPPGDVWKDRYVGPVVDYIESRGEPQWGIKDPRLVLLWPIWEVAFDKFGYDLIKVKVYRNPDRIVDSLYRRDGTLPDTAREITEHYHKKMREI